MYTDTHTHLYDEQFREEEAAMIQRALDAGVTKMYIPNCDHTTMDDMLRISDAWPDHCFPMMGLHPCYVKENYEEELQLIADWLAKRKFHAVGEIGIDKYWDLTFLEAQKEAFRRQIDLALHYDLPIVIHSRESTADCIEIVKEKQKGKLKGVFHCFSGTADEAREITELGFWLGIGGIVTFKKSTLPEIINITSLEHIVLETDAPYLAPVPYRGKRNESSYLPLMAQKIADLKQLSVAEVARITTENAEKLFN
jgi:TatD DNase family protein